MLVLMTQEALKKRYSYDPDTGIFRYLINVGSYKIGDVVGGPGGNGYWNIRINGYCYKGHRLAWLYMTGKDPDCEIDHINRNRSDNRFCNLREASRIENMQNSTARGNLTGVKGVRPSHNGKGYQAHITVANKQIFLGTYSTIELAAARRQLAEREYFGEFSILADDATAIAAPKALTGVAPNKITGERFIRPAPNAPSGFAVAIRRKHVGVFPTLELAIEARDAYLEMQEFLTN